MGNYCSLFQVSKDGKAIIVANSVDDNIHRKIGLSFGLVKRSHKSKFHIHWDYYRYGIIGVSHAQCVQNLLYYLQCHHQLNIVSVIPSLSANGSFCLFSTKA